HLPVLMRITTRMAHSRAMVECRETRKQNSLRLPDDPRQFVLLPAIAKKRYRQLLNLQPLLEKEAEKSPFNCLLPGSDSSLGIITCGIAHNYVLENYPDGVPYPNLKIGQYPVPLDLISKLVSEVDQILVLEEGYPLLEQSLRGLLNNGAKPVKGRLDGTVPRDGELTPDAVAVAMGLAAQTGPDAPEFLASRPPSMCKGCGHIDTYNALLEAIEGFGPGRTFSDIGCYTLGALPPFNAINSCVDMGASITMAKGAADAGLLPSVAVIGDSTFTHSGMTGLLDVVNVNSPITIIISDNETTGMTGGQTSSATGRLESICLGIGIDPEHLKVIIPLKKNHEENVRIIRQELQHPAPSVIISRRECIQTATRKRKEQKS
ncbi:MAG: thiamine pyrophosphate-dependent enzyme, partial [Bacteroidales bacterium]|nr:thiamine pyrophosphate-dependent enzyme [Bacteroidales bacterium]